MSDRDALFAAILAHPDEDTPRLALADWLDEHGEAKYAAFVRTQVELADVPFWDARRIAAWHHTRDALTGRDHPLFQPKLPDGLSYPSLTSFRRGFPWHVETLGVEPFLNNADRLVKQMPLQALTVRPEKGRWREPMDLTALLASPHLSRLKQLNFTLARLTPDAVRQIQACPHLANVTELSFEFAGLNALALAYLFRPPLVERLESLRFDSCSLNWGDLAASILSVLGPSRLKRFVASEDSSTYFRASPVFHAPLIHGLTEFELSGYDMGEPALAALCDSPVVAGLESLTLWSTKPGVPGVKALAACSALADVKRLRLRSNGIGPVAVKSLAKSPHLSSLQVLDLENNPLGDKGAVALADAPFIGNLIELDLMHGEVGDAGADALMNALSADTLISLNLHTSPREKIGAKVKKKLKDKFGDRAWA